MSECAIVVWQLVPYHDARFSAAARQVDLTVIEVFGQENGMPWSARVARTFAHVSLTKGKETWKPAHTWKRLEEELERLSPRIVAIQGWSDPAAFRTAHWALRHDAKVIIFSESNSYDHPRFVCREWLKSRFLGVCDAALVGGRDHTSYLVALGFDRDRVALGYNVVDNAHFAPTTRTESCDATPARAPYFLVVSRLVDGKNIERIIRAFAEYRHRSKRGPWDLVVLGVGPLEDHLRGVTANLNIGKHVHFEGFRQYHELPDIYHGAGALVHASIEEPWGLVINEAMASGLPVVVSNRCGCACELVRHGVNGFSFEPESTEAITQHMVALSDGYVDRNSLGKNSRRIISDWGPARFANGFQEVVDVARRSSSRKKMLDQVVVRALAQRRSLLSPPVSVAAAASRG